jgi:hypothetical protein
VEKWRNNQQETLIYLIYIKNMKKKNSIYNRGSSETIRKALYFDFSDFYKYGHANHVPRIEESFLEWFIGFFEGDGSLSFSKKSLYNRSRNGKNYIEPVCERLLFTICQKERQIIEKIAYTFGFGSVSCFKKNENFYWRWSVDSKDSIERISYLLSGNLILIKRQEQFLKWVEIGQKKNMFKLPFDKNKPWNSNISLNNGWISGFIDAEGCFYANFSIPRILKQKIKTLPTMKKKWSKQDYEIFFEISKFKFTLKQKISLTQILTSENLELFKKILILFEGKSLYFFNNNKISKLSYNEYIRIEFNSLVSHELIITYLTTYPLKTIKNISFKRWKRIYLRRKEGVHLSPKGTKKLYRLVNAINIHSKELYDKKYTNY